MDPNTVIDSMLPPQWWTQEVDTTLLSALLDRVQEECGLSLWWAQDAISDRLLVDVAQFDIYSLECERSFNARLYLAGWVDQLACSGRYCEP